MISWCDPDLIPKEDWEKGYAEPIMAGARARGKMSAPHLFGAWSLWRHPPCTGALGEGRPPAASFLAHAAGQMPDATAAEVRKMNERLAVFHDLTKGCAQSEWVRGWMLTPMCSRARALCRMRWAALQNTPALLRTAPTRTHTPPAFSFCHAPQRGAPPGRGDPAPGAARQAGGGGEAYADARTAPRLHALRAGALTGLVGAGSAQ